MSGDVAVTEEKEVQGIAIEATSRLKQALTNERETKIRMEDNIKQLKVRTKTIYYCYGKCAFNDFETY